MCDYFGTEVVKKTPLNLSYFFFPYLYIPENCRTAGGRGGWWLAENRISLHKGQIQSDTNSGQQETQVPVILAPKKLSRPTM